MSLGPLAAAVAVLVAVTLPAGGRVFGLAVVAGAAASLLDVAALLGRGGRRPVVAAATLSAVVLPATAVADPAGGWERVPGYVAATLLGSFALVLLFGRRRRVTAGLGATSLAGLLVGLGAVSLILLRALEDGFRWTVAALLLAAVPAAAASLTRRLPRLAGVSPAAAGVVLAALAAAALGATLDPPLTAVRTLALLAVAVAAGLAAAALVSVLRGEDVPEPRGATGAPGSPGAVLSVTGGVLLAAPGAYLLARAVQL